MEPETKAETVTETAAEPETAIKLVGVSKSFTITDPTQKKGMLGKKKTRFEVFHDLNLEIKRGEVVGVIGRNGSGKSTFLKIVSEILDPDEGTVEINGKVASILELSMGFHPDLTGRENILIRTELYGISHKDLGDNIEKIVDYADLGVYIDNPVKTYSSGMRSRLAFAVMVSVDAEIYIIDEALSTGDAAFSAKASEHLKNLIHKGKTILFTSHNSGFVENACERAIWLHEKTIYRDGPSDEVCAEYNRSIMDSFQLTKDLAEDGASSAMYRLATFYRDGHECEPDREMFLYWLEQAAMREHPMAMDEYGDILVSKGNIEQAAEMYKKAAIAENRDARIKYANLTSDETAGLHLLRDTAARIAQDGFPSDQLTQGLVFLKTALQESDYSEAAKWLTMAADGGNIEAAFQLGQMYRSGRGIQRDMERAIQMYESAAERGHARAASTLAELYEDGKFVDRDYEKAFQWYLLSAREGNMRAMYSVAEMYLRGLGTEQDEESAKLWFSRLAAANVANIMLDVSENAADRMRDKRTAATLLSCAAEGRHARAVVKHNTSAAKHMPPEELFQLYSDRSVMIGKPRGFLARLYAEGVGVDANPDEAFRLYKDAADGGDQDAMFRIASMYKDGVGTEVNTELYRLYMRMAADKGNRDATAMVQKWNRRNEKRQKDAEKDEEPDGSLHNPDSIYPPVQDENSDEIYQEALRYKPGSKEADQNRYRTLMRKAAERGNPTAIKIVEKWDARIAKRKGNETPLEKKIRTTVKDIGEKEQQRIRNDAILGDAIAKKIVERWDEDGESKD